MTSISELHQAIKSKKRSAVEITTEYLNTIEKLEPQIKSFLWVTKDLALETAQKVDEKVAKGEEINILEGIPMAIKDNMSTKGIPTTCASRILENFIPSYESTVTQKLRDKGAVILGKTTNGL